VPLFVDRASAVQPDFELTAQNAEAVGAFVTRADGQIPHLHQRVARQAGEFGDRLELAHAVGICSSVLPWCSASA
jgi:hypothetical protein